MASKLAQMGPMGLSWSWTTAEKVSVNNENFHSGFRKGTVATEAVRHHK